MRSGRAICAFGVVSVLLTAGTGGMAAAQPQEGTPGLVTNLKDSGAGSLRDAVGAGAPSIQFAPGLTGTITLTSGQLTIRNNTSIQGPGPGSLTISGNGRSRIFEVAPGAAAQIAGLAVVNGLNRGDDRSSGTADPGVGGGIQNDVGATLTLSQVLVINNHAEGGDSNGTFGYTGRGGDAWGGGIRNLGTLTVSNSIVTGNTAKAGYGGDSHFYFGHGGVAYGGGIANSGTLAVQGSQVTKNQSIGGATEDGDANDGHGGGIYSSQALSLQNSSVSANTARGGHSGGSAPGGDGFGGGIEADGTNGNPGGMTLVASIVNDNVAKSGSAGDKDVGTFGGTAAGGGILASGAPAGTRQIASSTISGNQALGGDRKGDAKARDGLGGDIFASGPMSVLDTTINANLAVGGSGASGLGGGVYNDGRLTAGFDTLSSNRGSSAGWSFFTGGNAQTSVGNTIIAGGGANNCSGRAVTSTGYNLEDANSCKFAQVGDKPNTDPKLGPLQGNGGPVPTRALLPGSPAIDQANSTGGPVTDARGLARPVVFGAIPRPPGGNGADIGAFELQSSELPRITLQPSPLAFSPQKVGTISAPRAVTVGNTGVQSLSISAVKVTGSHASEFLVSSDECAGKSLASGQTCTVSVRFAPADQGTRDASLSFTSNAPTSPDSVPLSGQGSS